MPVVARNYPLPRGNLTHGLGSFYTNQSASAAVTVTGNSGKYAQAGLFNNSTVGTLLYVIGMSAWNTDATGDITMYAINQIPAGCTITPGTSINPLMSQLEGQLISTPNGVTVVGNPVWRLSGGNNSEAWPYEYPMIIIPSGFAFLCQPARTASTVSAAFRWLVIKPGHGS
jgi:hypothetical protein